MYTKENRRRHIGFRNALLGCLVPKHFHRLRRKKGAVEAPAVPLEDFQYTPLRDQEREIRVLELLPGQPADIIRVKIRHVPLVEPMNNPQNEDIRMPLDELQATLPAGWGVYRNLEGKYLFYDWENDNSYWRHPNPKIERHNYELQTEIAGFHPRYEAVSYAWGSERKSRSIEVVGEVLSNSEPKRNSSPIPSKLTRMAITESLLEALQHLRYPESPRAIWVDAICINQANSIEKSQQVCRMSEIYRLAHRVVVWLGPEADQSTHALSTLKYIGEQFEYGENGSTWFFAPEAKEKTWAGASFDMPYGQQTWDSIVSLLRRRWFTRLWVVQEVHLANKQPGAVMQCGHDVITFSTFQNAALALSHMVTLPSGVESEAGRAAGLVCVLKNLILHRLLEQVATEGECLDDRDRLYGLLALAPPRFAAKIHPDYRGTCSPSRVYQTAFVTHMQQVQRLELLEHCFAAGRQITNMPSWVPDWSADFSGMHALFAQWPAGTSRARFVYSDDKPEVLKVLGVRCSVINHVSEPLPVDVGTETAVQHVRRWQPPDLDSATYMPTGETMREAYATTLMHEELIERWPEYPDYCPGMEEWARQDWPAALFGEHVNDTRKRVSEAQEQEKRHVERALNRCMGRAFIRTTGGYIGLGPADTKLGDEVVILLGCSVVLLLRPAGAQGAFRVIGQCFIHGLQDARCLLGPITPPWRVIAGTGLGGRYSFCFYNTETGEETMEDPRLEPLAEWERIEREPDADDPEFYDFFRHKETGEVLDYEPRLEPEELEKRGVVLEWFTLI